jgi:hypothetical protein
MGKGGRKRRSEFLWSWAQAGAQHSSTNGRPRNPKAKAFSKLEGRQHPCCISRQMMHIHHHTVMTDETGRVFEESFNINLFITCRLRNHGFLNLTVIALHLQR